MKDKGLYFMLSPDANSGDEDEENSQFIQGNTDPRGSRVRWQPAIPEQ